MLGLEFENRKEWFKFVRKVNLANTRIKENRRLDEDKFNGTCLKGADNYE